MSAAEWVAARDFSGLQEIVEGLSHYPDLRHAIVLDLRGQVLAHSDPTRRGLYLTDLPQTAELRALPRGGGLVDVTSPVMLAGHHIGWVRIGLARDSLDAKLAQVTRGGILNTLIAIALSTLFAALTGRYLTRRLYAIQQVADAVQGGASGLRAVVPGDDEAAQLARQFNGMLDALAQREEALWVSEARFRLMVASVKDYAIVMLDVGGRVVNWNAGAERIKGYRADEIIGAHFSRFYSKEDVERGKPERELAVAAAEGRFEDDDWRVRKDGSRFNAELEQRVQERTAQFQEANKELEAFSYSVSHDLRAPLRHVQGYVDMLTREAESQVSEKGRRFLRTIADASREMGVLIDDLLAFSRMGRAQMAETRVNLDALVREALPGLETATPERNIVWKVPPLPAVLGDPAMLKLVFANLLGNAVKYTRPRDPAQIEIGCAGTEDGRVILFVRDNGVGFDPQYAHKLFGVFQRLHRADEFEGTGIGLANVRRIITRHGGRTWAEGKLNEGATFYFTLKPV